jgi:outer membrane protein OmpA-like peptidoglycan-associated protein
MFLKFNARVLGVALAALLGLGSVYAAILVLWGDGPTFDASRQASQRDGAAKSSSISGRDRLVTKEADRAIVALTDSFSQAPGGPTDATRSPLAFDIARIAPGEPSVVAGRAGAGQTVDVLADGVVVGSATADDSGNWVLVIDRWPARPDAKLGLRPGIAKLAAREPTASPPTARDAAATAGRQTRVSAANADMMRQLDTLISQARQSPSESSAVANPMIEAPQRPTAAGPHSVEQKAAGPNSHAVVPVPIQFEFQTAQFTPYGRQAAAKLMEYLKVSSRTAIALSGHADDRGSDAYNIDLSRKRLQTVEFFLRASGYTGELKLLPMGKSEPFRGVDRSSMSRDELFQLDRRVELHIVN